MTRARATLQLDGKKRVLYHVKKPDDAVSPLPPHPTRLVRCPPLYGTPPRLSPHSSERAPDDARTGDGEEVWVTHARPATGPAG